MGLLGAHGRWMPGDPRMEASRAYLTRMRASKVFLGQAQTVYARPVLSCGEHGQAVIRCRATVLRLSYGYSALESLFLHCDWRHFLTRYTVLSNTLDHVYHTAGTKSCTPNETNPRASCITSVSHGLTHLARFWCSALVRF